MPVFPAIPTPRGNLHQARQRCRCDFIDDQLGFACAAGRYYSGCYLSSSRHILYPASTPRITSEAMNINNVDIMHLKKGEVNLGVRPPAATAC